MTGPTKPGPFDRAQIEHVAVLASLSLAEDEIARMTTDVGRILGYVEELATLDTTDVPPTTSVQLERSAWRPDEVRPGVTHDDALAQAPRQAHGGFAVPTFVGE